MAFRPGRALVPRPGIQTRLGAAGAKAPANVTGEMREEGNPPKLPLKPVRNSACRS